jgi:hypothetical protein
MARRTVDNAALERWRRAETAPLVALLADHAKEDMTFKPVKATGATRWHVSAGGADYELICTGAKFFDTRAGIGGAGAIDLTCHLWRIGFKDAVRILRSRGA